MPTRAAWLGTALRWSALSEGRTVSDVYGLVPLDGSDISPNFADGQALALTCDFDRLFAQS